MLSIVADALPSTIISEIHQLRDALDLPEVDYVETMKAKLRISRQIFDAIGQETLKVR